MISIGQSAEARHEHFRGLVDAERDRRIVRGFTFDGASYDYDVGSQSHISGAATLAGFAKGAGAKREDYLWNGAGVDFTWLTSDNTRVAMDAQTMFRMGQAAMEHVRAHIFAARALKDQALVPNDYTSDKWWPTPEEWY